MDYPIYNQVTEEYEIKDPVTGRTFYGQEARDAIARRDDARRVYREHAEKGN